MVDKFEEKIASYLTYYLIGNLDESNSQNSTLQSGFLKGCFQINSRKKFNFN